MPLSISYKLHQAERSENYLEAGMLFTLGSPKGNNGRLPSRTAQANASRMLAFACVPTCEEQ